MGGSDVAIWNLAPVAFATALFYSRTWQDADFRPALEAHSNNVSATAIAILEVPLLFISDAFFSSIHFTVSIRD